jgi:DNA recombination-dependent growth factor C
MGIIKGSATLSRYKVKGELPQDFKDFIDERIRKFAFRDIENNAEEESMGWVSIHDYMDTSFAYAAYALDPYVVLGLRIDKRQISGALLKKYHRIELKKAYAMNDGRKPSRMEREELKEKARLDLLTRIPPTSKSYELVWDTQGGQVWLGSAARSVRDLAEDLFKRTFELDLVALIPWDLAQEAADTVQARQALEEASAWSLFQEEA